jgi:hypothetical protein
VGVQFGAGYVVRGDSGGGEELVEEYPGTGADLSFGDSQAGEVSGGGDAAWVAWCDEQALLAPPQVEQVWAAVAKQGSCERRVVGATVVTQVDRDAISGAPGQGAQSLETSAIADRNYRRADVGQHDLQSRIIAAS